jgi:hypothetical protein
MSGHLRASLLASAAFAMVTAASGAHAQPVDFVRVCDAFGSGFFYIPGTDTCLRVGGFVRGDLMEGPDYRVRGFAFEPQPGNLQNPLFDFNVETDGQRFSAGIDLGRIAGLSSAESTSIITGLMFSADFIDVEGRAFPNVTGFTDVEGRALPNFGIPGVGQDFGSFINSPTFVSSTAGVGVEGWGVRGEVRIDPFALMGVQVDPNSRTKVGVIAGFRYGENETDIGHSVWASTPAFFNQADTWAKYATRIDERTVTPYVGLSVYHTINLGPTMLHLGMAGRVGPSFTDVEVHDSLRAMGLGGRINLVQDIRRESSETLTYGSLSGSVGISGGPIKVSFVGMAEHGLLNQPNITRRGNVETSPGNFETVPTDFNLEEDWTFSAGLRLSVSFSGR